jgi:hypothetical protein
MSANHSIDPAQFLSEHLERAEPDLLRSMLQMLVEALMGRRGRCAVWRPLRRAHRRSGHLPQWLPVPAVGNPCRNHGGSDPQVALRGPTSSTGCWTLPDPRTCPTRPV